MFQRFLENLQRCFRNNTGFMTVLFILNFFTLAWSLLLAGSWPLLWEYGAVLALCIFFGTVLLDRLLARRPSWLKWAKKTLLLLCLVPFVVECFVMHNYRALIGAGIVNSILETNSQEAAEFLFMYVGWREIAFVTLLLAGLFLLGKHRPWEQIPVSEKWQPRLLWAGLIAALVTAVPAFTVDTEFILTEMVPWQRTCRATATAIENIEAYHRLASMVDPNVNLTENRGKIRNIVFILGESTNRNHMHLYGYYLPNTPHLDELAQRDEICVFRDVISPHSTTIAVLSELFTFCDHESDKPWYEYHNLIDIMNAAGYKTFWLSNQESSGIWGNVAQIYAHHSKWHRFTRIRDSQEDNGTLDEELIPLLEEAKAEYAADRNFYVLHLMGGHGLYYNRFPYRFNKFTKDDIQLDVSERFRDIVAQYDNALYYNDYVVSNIIDRFRDEETLIIYVPDHGEAVYDEGNIAGHIEENPNRHMIEIPMVVWASKSFREKYPGKWASIKAAVDRPYMTDDLIHTILDLTDIKTEDFRPEKSIINPDFDDARPRIFSDLDYDTQIRDIALMPDDS